MRFVDFNIESDLKIGDYENKKMTLSPGDKKSIKFQVPRMYMPFGVSGFTPQVGPEAMKQWVTEQSALGQEAGLDEDDELPELVTFDNPSN